MEGMCNRHKLNKNCTQNVDLKHDWKKLPRRLRHRWHNEQVTIQKYTLVKMLIRWNQLRMRYGGKVLYAWRQAFGIHKCSEFLGHLNNYQLNCGTVPRVVMYEGLSKSFRIGRLEWELQMAQLSATKWSCITVLWVSLVSFAAVTLCVASQRVIPKVSVYFIIDSVRKLLDTPSYLCTNCCLICDIKHLKVAEFEVLQSCYFQTGKSKLLVNIIQACVFQRTTFYVPNFNGPSITFMKENIKFVYCSFTMLLHSLLDRNMYNKTSTFYTKP
jgi:hypothetical protein